MADEYKLTIGGSVIRLADNCGIPADPTNSDYATYLQWLADGNVPEPYVAPPEPSQFEKDQTRYQRRAAVRDSLIAYMAADNMSRVRSGAWSVADLTGLMVDPHVAMANNYMSTLSFELAAQAIAQATTELLTPEIRADWTGRMQAHFYLEG